MNEAYANKLISSVDEDAIDFFGRQCLLSASQHHEVESSFLPKCDRNSDVTILFGLTFDQFIMYILHTLFWAVEVSWAYCQATHCHSWLR